MAVLSRHRWPGNVRELENVIYRSAVIAQGDAILVKDLPAEIRPVAVTAEISGPTGRSEMTAPILAVEHRAEKSSPLGASLTLDDALNFVVAELSAGTEPLLARLEKEIVARVLKAEGDDPAKAAKRLGLTKAALQKRLKASASI